MSVETRASGSLQQVVGIVGDGEGKNYEGGVLYGHDRQNSLTLVTNEKRSRGGVGNEQQFMVARTEGGGEWVECNSESGSHLRYSHEEEKEQNIIKSIDKDHLNDNGVDMNAVDHQSSKKPQCLEKSKRKERFERLGLEHGTLVKAHAINVDMTLGIIHSMVENGMSSNQVESWVEEEKRKGNSIVGWIKNVDVPNDEIVLSMPGTLSNEEGIFDTNGYSYNSREGNDVKLKLFSSAMDNVKRLVEQCGMNSENYAYKDGCRYRYSHEDAQNSCNKNSRTSNYKQVNENEHVNKNSVDTTDFSSLSRTQTQTQRTQVVEHGNCSATTTDRKCLDNNNRSKEQSERLEQGRLMKIHAVNVDMALSVIQSMVMNGMPSDQIDHWVKTEKMKCNSIVSLIDRVDLVNEEIMLSLPGVLSNVKDTHEKNSNSDDNCDEGSKVEIKLPLFSKAQQQFPQQNVHSEQVLYDEEDGHSDDQKQSEVKFLGESSASDASDICSLELCGVCFSRKGKGLCFIQCKGCKLTVHPCCYFEEEWVNKCSFFLCDVCQAIKVQKEMYSLREHQQQQFDRDALKPLNVDTQSTVSIGSVYPPHVDLKGLDLSCVLCLRRDVAGALRATAEGRWCHLTCSMSCFTCFVKDGYIHSAPESLSTNKKYIRDMFLANHDKEVLCDCCGLSGGLLLPCASHTNKSEKPCHIFQHPLCAELSNCARVTKARFTKCVGRVATVLFKCAWHTFGTDSCCKICRRASEPNKMLACDRCDVGFHMNCLSPPIDNVPIGEWFCPDCKGGTTTISSANSTDPADKDNNSTLSNSTKKKKGGDNTNSSANTTDPSDKDNNGALSVRKSTRKKLFPSKESVGDAKTLANLVPSLRNTITSPTTRSEYAKFKTIVDYDIAPRLEKSGWTVTNYKCAGKGPGKVIFKRLYKHPSINGRIQGRISLVKALVDSHNTFAYGLAKPISKAWKSLVCYPKLAAGAACIDNNRHSKMINDKVTASQRKKRKNQTLYPVGRNVNFSLQQLRKRKRDEDMPRQDNDCTDSSQHHRHLLNGIGDMRKSSLATKLSKMAAKRKGKAPPSKKCQKKKIQIGNVNRLHMCCRPRNPSINAPSSREVHGDSWSSSRDCFAPFSPDEHQRRHSRKVNGAYVITKIMSSCCPQDGKVQCFLSYWAGDRLLTQEFKISDKNVEPKRQFTDSDGTSYSLVSTKLVDKKGKFGSGRMLRCMYVAVDGPSFNTKKWSLQRELEEIADFASLPPEKIVARLELFQTPCPKDRLFPNLKVDMFEMIEEDSHLGCGFIPEHVLEALLKGGSVAVRTVAIQVRIVSPALGIFKGVLVRKLGIHKIQLPSSMLKVSPSRNNTKERKTWVVMVTRQLFPSKTNRYLGRYLDPNLDDPPTKEFEYMKSKDMSPMIGRIIKGLGVKEEIMRKYYKQCKGNMGMKHAFLVGVCDPTKKLPQGSIFIPGYDKDERGSRKLLVEGHDDIFVTRCPCVEASDAKMLRVVSKKPKCMQQHVWDWLCNLSFGVIIFATPKNGNFRPLPETIAGGDLDGDLYFVCWDNEILQPLKHKDVKSHMKVTCVISLNTNRTEKSSVRRGRPSNKKNWLQVAQDRMLDFEYQNDINRLTGILCKLNERTADESEDHILNEDAIAYGKAYKMALDICKHGGKIYLPPHLHGEIKQECLHKFLSVHKP